MRILGSTTYFGAYLHKRTNKMLIALENILGALCSCTQKTDSKCKWLVHLCRIADESHNQLVSQQIWAC